MSRTVNNEIVSRLRQRIVSGAFDQVSFLPSERKLAEEYRVGRGIIRGALRVLKDEGILYNVPRRGLRVKKQDSKRIKRILLRLPIQMSAKVYEEVGLVGGICAAANDIFAEVLLSTPPAKLDLVELKERFNAGDIQGVILLERSMDITLAEFADSGVPCVIANLEEDWDFPGVRLDYRGVGRQAGQELLRAGRRKLAVYTGSLERFIYREIMAGFRGALAEEELQLDSDMIICQERQPGYTELYKLLSRSPHERPEALFTARDYRAAQAYSICEKLGLKIPEDISIISFDNISWPEAESKGLTTISEEVNEIGKQSVQLLRRIYEDASAPDSCTISGNLIRRSSI